MNEQLAKVMKVLKLRQCALRVTTAKLDRGLDATRLSDRLYDMFVYHPAHTGRFSSRDMQLHNLPRDLGVDYDRLLSAPLTLEAVDAEAVRLTAVRRSRDPRAPEVSPDDVLSSLVRLCIIAADGFSLIRADWAQIECRCLAWMANDEALLRDLADDVYLGMARRLYNDSTIAKTDPRRQVGKIVVLGAGYGLSYRKLEVFCTRARVDLEGSGITAKQAIEGFRKSYPGVPRLWALFDSRCKAAIENGFASDIGKCSIWYADRTLVVRLPSGRRLNYRNARIEMMVPMYAQFLDVPVDPKPTIMYDGPRGTKSLYGGKIVENVDQAICSDVLRDTLIKMEQDDLRPIAHVHDEPIGEVETGRAELGLNRLLYIMTQGPEWAKGFPLKAEGSVCQRYSK